MSKFHLSIFLEVSITHSHSKMARSLTYLPCFCRSASNSMIVQCTTIRNRRASQFASKFTLILALVMWWISKPESRYLTMAKWWTQRWLVVWVPLWWRWSLRRFNMVFLRRQGISEMTIWLQLVDRKDLVSKYNVTLLCGGKHKDWEE